MAADIQVSLILRELERKEGGTDQHKEKFESSICAGRDRVGRPNVYTLRGCRLCTISFSAKLLRSCRLCWYQAEVHGPPPRNGNLSTPRPEECPDHAEITFTDRIACKIAHCLILLRESQNLGPIVNSSKQEF